MRNRKEGLVIEQVDLFWGAKGRSVQADKEAYSFFFDLANSCKKPCQQLVKARFPHVFTEELPQMQAPLG